MSSPMLGEFVKYRFGGRRDNPDERDTYPVKRGDVLPALVLRVQPDFGVVLRVFGTEIAVDPKDWNVIAVEGDEPGMWTR